MKDKDYVLFCIKTIVLSVFGLSTVPFLACIVQYLDARVGINATNGYYSNHINYISESPLIQIVIVLCLNIIIASIYLFKNSKKKEQKHVV